MRRLDAESLRNLRMTRRTDRRNAIDAIGFFADPDETPASWVYFIRSGDAIKIGHARDPYTRLMNLRTASPNEVVYLGHTPGGRDDERTLHARFEHLRIRGEWFRAAPELLAFIAEHRFNADT